MRSARPQEHVPDVDRVVVRDDACFLEVCYLLEFLEGVILEPDLVNHAQLKGVLRRINLAVRQCPHLLRRERVTIVVDHFHKQIE